jgi:hypothetical protein
MDPLPLAVSLGQVVPVGNRAQRPQGAVDEQAVVTRRAPGSLALPGNSPATGPHWAFVSWYRFASHCAPNHKIWNATDQRDSASRTLM